MSAWFVNKKHIDIIVTGMANFDMLVTIGTRTVKVRGNETLVGKVLWFENARSIDARYNDDEDTAHNTQAVNGYVFENMGAVKTGALGKLTHSYAYQSCEHDGWEASDAKRMVDAIYDNLVAKLPGYDDAPWSISKDGDMDRAVDDGVSLSDLVKS